MYDATSGIFENILNKGIVEDADCLKKNCEPKAQLLDLAKRYPRYSYLMLRGNATWVVEERKASYKNYFKQFLTRNHFYSFCGSIYVKYI